MCLSKDEMQEFYDDPAWSKIRWIALIGFWVVWLGMLVLTISEIFLQS